MTEARAGGRGRLALGRRRDGHESKWWVFLGMLAVGLLHLVLPDQIAALHSPEVVGWTIVALAVVLFVAHREDFRQRSRGVRVASLGLLGLVILSNLVSLVLLVRAIVRGDTFTPTNLLLGGAVVWLTNVAAFGFLFWEYDRGGPAARDARAPNPVDLQFPQIDPLDPKPDSYWPRFVDYLYVAFTNALAFSPADTMPLSRWCKGLFALESMISFVTVALVAARAIGVLPAS